MTSEEEKDAIEAIELAMIRMSPAARKSAKEFIDKLTRYRDQTVGLWVTDKPQSVDEKKLMFQLKF